MSKFILDLQETPTPRMVSCYLPRPSATLGHPVRLLHVVVVQSCLRLCKIRRLKQQLAPLWLLIKPHRRSQQIITATQDHIEVFQLLLRGHQFGQG